MAKRNLSALLDTSITPAPHDEDTDETVRRVLSRWRWFWTADSSKLIEGGALGLLGELWFLPCCSAGTARPAPATTSSAPPPPSR